MQGEESRDRERSYSSGGILEGMNGLGYGNGVIYCLGRDLWDDIQDTSDTSFQA